MKVRCFAILLLVLSSFLPSHALAQTTVPTEQAAVISLRGQIDDFERDALMRRFRQARAAGAKTIILEIETYGGLVTSGLDISRFIKQQSDLHTIAFVHDKAISAGAMIAIACDEIVMQPSGVLGDCAPISYRSDGSLEAMPAAERAKAESPILADFRDSAVRNHYDPTLVESMVAVDRVVHYVQNGSDESSRKFVDDATFAKLTADGWKPVAGVRDPIDRGDELFTVHSADAEKVGLSRGTFVSTAALAEARNLNVIARYDRSVAERLVETLASSAARMLYLVIFVASLKLALSAPGHGAPEAICLLSLGLLVGMPLLTGYATWWEVVLIFAGLALLAFEIFVFPGHFVSGTIGILMILGGLIMTFVGGEPSNPNAPSWMPQMDSTIASLQRGLFIVTGGLLCSLLLWAWLSKYIARLPYFNRLVLSPAGGDATMLGALGADTVWPLVGATGRAVTELKPGGAAEFFDSTINDGRSISVVCESGYVRPGTELVVTESRGNRVVVKQVN